jgi:hypothetical protein
MVFSDVYSACENALPIDPFNADFHDSRGLARALTGDIKVRLRILNILRIGSPAGEALLRKNGLAALETGQNPFDEKTLLELKKPHNPLPDSQVLYTTVSLSKI